MDAGMEEATKTATSANAVGTKESADAGTVTAFRATAATLLTKHGKGSVKDSYSASETKE